MVEMCGVKSKDDIIGLHPWDISPPKQPDGCSSKEKAIEKLNAAYAEKPQRFYWQHKKSDGTLFDVDVSLNSFGLGGKKYIMIVWRDITERKQAEKRLQNYQAKLKSLASELLLAEERERRRIVTNLHDCIGQDLAFSKLKLDTLRKSDSSGVLAGPLGEINALLEEVIENTRSLTFDLSSPVLHKFGLERAVEEYLMQQVQDRHGIRSTFADDGLPKPLDYDVCAFLYRAVRELLINVVKHAQAHSVKVSTCRRDGEIEIVVEDDGVGLDLSEISPVMCGSGGLGLSNIRERLYYLSGHLKITSEPGHGTLVTLTAPLKTEKGATIESQNECYNYSGR